MLKIKNIHVLVSGKEILKGLNLEVPDGEIHAILGPNGSGKSTLAATIMGIPIYKVKKGKIIFNKKDITKLSLSERAKLGIFLAYQNPPEIKGILVRDFLSLLNPSLNIENILKKSFLNSDFKERELNVGFSGGEKKRSEIAQMFALNPKFVIFDEPDSGVDIESMNLIGKEISKFIKARRLSGLVITHQGYILKYIKPKKIHVMINGRIVCSSSDLKEVLSTIKKYGYKRCEECKKSKK